MHFVPKGSIKINDKHSDAVAYLYERLGHPCVMIYVGKQTKPIANYRFKSNQAREKTIRETFAARQQRTALKTKHRAERKAETHSLQIGHVLQASWGYDQTNVDFYQVTKIISPKMVELRKIGSTETESTGSMSGKVMPMIDHFIGEPMRKRVGRSGGARIDSVRYANVWNGKPAYESSYA